MGKLGAKWKINDFGNIDIAGKNGREIFIYGKICYILETSSLRKNLPKKGGGTMEEFVILEHTELRIKVKADTLEEAIDKANETPREQWVGEYHDINGRTLEEFNQDFREMFCEDLPFEELANMTADEAKAIIQRNKKEDSCTAV
jgi:hypothetical protein